MTKITRPRTRKPKKSAIKQALKGKRSPYKSAKANSRKKKVKKMLKGKSNRATHSRSVTKAVHKPKKKTTSSLKLSPKKDKTKKTYPQVTSRHWQQTFSSKQQKKRHPSKKSKPAASSFHAKHPKIISALRFIFFPIINPYARYGLLLLLLGGISALVYFMKDLPSPRRLTSQDNFAVSTQIFDRNGVLLYEIFADENRIPIKIKTLPQHVLQATIAIEDKNFYSHFGFDIEGIIRAVNTNLRGERLEGGSTITQQLVKNALLSPERSVKRKIKEAILAVFTELIYSKEEILEMYLNYISYGGTSVGIQAAAQKYFDKNASELTLAEAALLAGLPQAPSRYSPFGSDPEKARLRQADVLRRMAEEEFITLLQAENAKSEVLNYALSKTDILAPHFVFYVRDLLYKEFGEETVEKGGLRVTTTLDLGLQNAAQASLSAEVKTLTRLKVGNGAAMITKPNSGEILVMIGSKDYFDTAADGQVNVTLSFRQPGSSIKPLMYATAFQNKTLNPGTILLDIPTCFKIPNQKDYCPRNYSGDFKGPVAVRQSLGNSLNIPAVKALSTIGVERFMEQATKMGITTWHDPSNYGLSLTLGGGEVRMIDMAQSFGVLANQGVKVPLTPILKIENYKGEIIKKIDIEQRLKDLVYLTDFENDGQQSELERVMDRAPAYLTSHIMQDNNARLMAFGSRSQLVIKGQVVSAKTGTTNNLKDNWTIGFTPDFLVVTWVGNNDNTSMSYLASGVTGAAPIFNDIMTFVLQNKESRWQEKPTDIAQAEVCANGFPPHLSDKKCSARYKELYWKKSRPSLSFMETKQVWIKPETGLPPAFGEEVEGLVLEERTIYQDPVTQNYCLDCNRPVDEEGKTIYEKYIIENINFDQQTETGDN